MEWIKASDRKPPIEQPILVAIPLKNEQWDLLLCLIDEADDLVDIEFQEPLGWTQNVIWLWCPIPSIPEGAWEESCQNINLPIDS